MPEYVNDFWNDYFAARYEPVETDDGKRPKLQNIEKGNLTQLVSYLTLNDLKLIFVNGRQELIFEA